MKNIQKLSAFAVSLFLVLAPFSSVSATGTTTPSLPATPPTITLNGSALVILNIGDLFLDPGAIAMLLYQATTSLL